MNNITNENLLDIGYAFHNAHKPDAYEDSNRSVGDKMGRMEEALENTEWFTDMHNKYGHFFLDWHYDYSAEIMDDLGNQSEDVTEEMLQKALEDSFIEQVKTILVVNFKENKK